MIFNFFCLSVLLLRRILLGHKLLGLLLSLLGRRCLRGLGLGLGHGLRSIGGGLLGVNKLLRIGNVAPTEVATTEFLGAGRAARNAGDVGTAADVLLNGLLLSLGLVAGGLVLVGALALHVAPDAVHDFLLVAANLEAIVLAELVENAGGAVAEFVQGLAGRRVLNLFGLQDLLGLGGGLSGLGGNGLLENMLEQVSHAVSNQGAKGVLDVGLKLVLSDEVVNAGLDGSHLVF